MRCVQVEFAGLHGARHLGEIGEHHALALGVDPLAGGVVETENDILRRHDDRLAVGRRQDVVGGQHQRAGFHLRFERQRHVHGHLVTVEVGVEAAQTSGCSWIALPSISVGSKAWMPRRCSVGARLSMTGCSRITSSRMSHTTGSWPRPSSWPA
jgi:hypothetical protein